MPLFRVSGYWDVDMLIKWDKKSKTYQNQNYTRSAILGYGSLSGNNQHKRFEHPKHPLNLVPNREGVILCTMCVSLLPTTICKTRPSLLPTTIYGSMTCLTFPRLHYWTRKSVARIQTYDTSQQVRNWPILQLGYKGPH